MALSPGQILRGHYQIVELVGKGGMGYVYRAEDITNNYYPVAIKEMIQQNLSSSELRDAQVRFQQEANLLQSLSHPNLPKVYASFTELGHSYLVMDFIEGQNLADLLVTKMCASEKLSVDTVVEYGIALCDVLEYLHSRPQAIIYRDLKPANVMVTDTGHVYLVDFGIARIFKPGQTMDTERFVTPGFCPPEQLQGDEQTDERSDLYSLGATLYYCLTGRHPKDNKPTMFNFARLSPQEAPPRLNNLLLNLVATDKDKRPANIRVVAQDLRLIRADAVTININSNMHMSDYYYNQKLAQEAQIQMQVRMWLNSLPLLARRGWSNLYPVLLSAGTNVWSWLAISLIPFCMSMARKIHTTLPTWSLGQVSLNGLFPAGIPLLAITGLGSLYLLDGQHNPLPVVVLALCLLFTLMGFNATFQQTLPLPARYGLAGATALAFLSCLMLIAQPDIQAYLMGSAISNFLSLILIALALASLLRKNTQQFWLDHLAMIACTIACAVLTYHAALSFSGLRSGTPSLAAVMTMSIFGTIALLELLSYRARFSSWSWFLFALVAISYTIFSCMNIQEIIRTFPAHITISSDMSVADSLKVLLVLLIAFVPLVIAAIARWSPARSSIKRLVIPVLAIGCVVQLQQLAQGLSLPNFSTSGPTYTIASSVHDVFSPNQFVAIALVLLTLWLFVGLFANPRQAQLDYVGLLSVGIVFILFQRSIPEDGTAPLFTDISFSLTFLSAIMPALILLLIISVICLFMLLAGSSALHATINPIRLPALAKWMEPAQPGFGHLILFLCTTVSLWLQWFLSSAEPLHDVSLTGQVTGFSVAQLFFFVSLFLWIVSAILLLRSGKHTHQQKKSTFSAMARIILCYNALLAALLLFNMHKLGPLSVQDTLQWLGIASLPTSPFLINFALLLAAFLLFITADTASTPNVAPTARTLASGALIFAVLQFFWSPLALITFILLIQHVRFITAKAASI